MAGISIHVIDVSRGVPAIGMRVALYRQGARRELLAEAAVGVDGSVPLPDAIGRAEVPAGLYEAVFGVGAFFRARGDALPSPAFLEEAPFVFGIADPRQHYHLPMKLTPWGFSLFRGGA